MKRLRKLFCMHKDKEEVEIQIHIIEDNLCSGCNGNHFVTLDEKLIRNTYTSEKEEYIRKIMCLGCGNTCIVKSRIFSPIRITDIRLKIKYEHNNRPYKDTYNRDEWNRIEEYILNTYGVFGPKSFM